MKMFNMRKILSAAAVASGMSLVAAPASAALIPVDDCIDDGMCVGSITTADGGVTAADGWTSANGGFLFSWDISLSGTTWTYIYTLTAEDGTTLAKAPSHAIFEVSPDFDQDLAGLGLPQTWGADPLSPNNTSPGGNNGNPNLPADLFGIKSDAGGETYTFMTDVVPVWGDFYTKDGTDAGIASSWERATSAMGSSTRVVPTFTTGPPPGWGSSRLGLRTFEIIML